MLALLKWEDGRDLRKGFGYPPIVAIPAIWVGIITIDFDLKRFKSLESLEPTKDLPSTTHLG